mgnify:CR=1 FL=1
MPQIFTVYQIDLSDIQDLINTEGWDCHVKAVAYIQNTIHDNPAISVMHFDNCYTKVAEVVADDLNHVFEVGNIGPEDRITRFARMHSFSVGDIIEDVESNRWMIAGSGFTPLTESFKEAS